MFSPWLSSMAQQSQPCAPPPDVILEVGPPPFARFAAHSVLLSAHSGYLRSAMRVPPLDADRKYEQNAIYLHNITADQLGPLLSYMYTGYLDLTVDNIFAVLLASHVLHMPRAADICRAFLARSQSEGYLGGSFDVSSSGGGGGLSETNNERMVGASSRVVRPIASKASVSGISFVAPPTSNVLMPSQDTPFRSLTQSDDAAKRAQSPVAVKELIAVVVADSAPNKVIEDNIVVSPKKRPLSVVVTKSQCLKKMTTSKTAIMCDVVADPVKFDPDASTNTSGSTTIVDIAACDGPVRFRRVLNEAYGRSGGATTTIRSTPAERTQQHLTTSFHMQMAKAISEHTNQHGPSARNSDESENSQDIKVSSDAVNPEPPPLSMATSRVSLVKPADEVYSCVYCKHTFKSQYCYQKHAKRHINPLTIDDTERIVETIDSDSDDRSSSGGGGGSGGGRQHGGCRRRTIVRREVRPLDMNVQYYPCKTCGSKFPSYYFVHKHRKLCHSNEDN